MKQPRTKDNLTHKFTIKLESSGISLQQAKLLGYVPLSAEQTEKLGHRKIPSLKLPYYDEYKKPLKFYRIRYLESTKKGILAQTDVKEQRYDQPSGLPTELYMPPLWKHEWIEEFSNEEPLIVTEGELKAAAGCINGLATVALGGVWNFGARKKGVSLLPIFKKLTPNKRVYIIFDSDSATNPQVAAAENVFATELVACKLEPCIIRLPSIDNKKTGLDDYLLARSAGELKELLEEAEPFRYGVELHKMNEEVIYIENPSLVLRHSDGYKMGVPTFKNEVYVDRTYIDTSGEKPKKVSTAKEWVGWPGRGKAAGFIYEPGQPALVDNKINMWKGLPYQPRKGDVGPWLKLMDYVFHGDKAARKWFEAWLAYPLQHQGIKLFTAAVMWSVQTGTGKTLIGHTMQKLYGDNSIMVRKRDLVSGDNSFAENKQFVLGEEITGDEKRSMVDELKSLITNEELRINIKYVPQYSIRSCANYYFTSNNPDAFHIDETDRRFFIHEIIGDPLPEDWYTTIYDPWYKSKEGAEALLYYLLNLDTKDFKPMSRPPMTAAKTEMIENSRSALSNWVVQLRDNPDKALRIGNAILPYALWSTEELLKVFDPEDKKRVGVRGMGVELKRARVAKAARGMGCKSNIGQCRLWAIRNPRNYVDMYPVDVGKARDKERENDEKISKLERKKK